MPGTFRNISSERIGEADRWAMVTRMLYDPSIHELLRSKNASVVMPRDRQSLFQRYAIATVAGEPDSDPDLLTADAPSLRFEAGSLATHRLDTTFLSASRSATDSDEDAVERKDLFIVQTELVEVASGRAVWSGSSEFARVARGLILD